MRKIVTTTLIILLLTLASGMESSSAEPERNIPEAIASLIRITPLDTAGKREILGTVTSNIYQKYAVIKDSDSGKKFIYRNGDYIDNELKIIGIYDDFLALEGPDTSNNLILIPGIPYTGVEFVEAVELNRFEYSYRLMEQDKEIKDNRFELVNIQGHKAILERDYIEQPISARQEPPKPSIDEIFFKQVKTKEISEYTWEVDSQSVTTPVVDSVQKVIAYAAKRVRATGFGKNGLRLGFSSKVCSGELDRTGFLVDELSPQVREKAGLAEGDIIKTINGRGVYNIIDLIFLFLEIRNGSASEVNVELLRNNEVMRLTYIVK